MSAERPSQHRYAAPETYTPDAVAASLGRNDGGFGRNQQSYYDEPVLHKAHWGWEIISYFWVGGIMSGSALLGALTDSFGSESDATFVRNARWIALVGAAASGALLIKDLGRPERFHHMLRIVKFGSPMSIGTWTLSWFSFNAASTIAAQLKRDRVLPIDLAGFIPLPLRNGMLATSAAIMALYTGVLVAATAIPVWYRGRRTIPAIFVASAFGTACSLNVALLALAGASPRTIAKLERIETIAAAAELALLELYKRDAGDAGKPFFTGPIGKRVRTWTQLLGVAVPLILNTPAWFNRDSERRGTRRRLPLLTLAGSALSLYGGYVLRESIVLAGRISGDDPKPVLQISHENA